MGIYDTSQIKPKGDCAAENSCKMSGHDFDQRLNYVKSRGNILGNDNPANKNTYTTRRKSVKKKGKTRNFYHVVYTWKWQYEKYVYFTFLYT